MVSVLMPIRYSALTFYKLNKLTTESLKINKNGIRIGSKSTQNKLGSEMLRSLHKVQNVIKEFTPTLRTGINKENFKTLVASRTGYSF